MNTDFAIGDRVVAVGVQSPATGVVLEVHGGNLYTVEWQSDYLTEVVRAEDITSKKED
jgi:hypothetical protein